MTQWYYGHNGQQFGPFTDEQLKQLADSGQLQSTDVVWKKGMAQWVKASQLKGLFPPVATPGQQHSPAPVSSETNPTPLTSPPNEQDAGSDIESLTATPPAPSANDSVSPHVQTTKGKAKELLGSLASRAKAAGLLIAKQTERTKLLNVTLPHHYQALGKHLYGHRQYADEFASLFQNIDALAAQIKTLQSRPANEPKAEGIAAKTKAAAKAAQDAVQGKTLKLKLGHALAELGKAAFEQHGEGSGPEELIRPIANAKSRADQLAAEIAQLLKVPAGQILTPKRIAIGGVAVVCILLLAIGLSDRGQKRGADSDTPTHQDGSYNYTPSTYSRTPSSPDPDHDLIQNMRNAGTYTPEAERNVRSLMKAARDIDQKNDEDSQRIRRSGGFD